MTQTPAEKLERTPAPREIPPGLFCCHCGYDLRMADAAGVCPECGTAVARSLDFPWLRQMSPRWVRRLRWGVRSEAAALPPAFLMVWTGLPWYPAIANHLQVAGIIASVVIWAMAGWLIGGGQPAEVRLRWPQLAKIASALLVPAYVPFVLLLLLPWPAPWGFPPAWVILALSLTFAMQGVRDLLLAMRLRQLAGRIPARRLAAALLLAATILLASNAALVWSIVGSIYNLRSPTDTQAVTSWFVVRMAWTGVCLWFLRSTRPSPPAPDAPTIVHDRTKSADPGDEPR